MSIRSLLAKIGLFLRLIGHGLSSARTQIYRRLTRKALLSAAAAAAAADGDTTTPRNVVVIGASFAGYYTARALAAILPEPFRVVVVEPHSHFHFTWVLPRFSVVPGHERKALIPYGPLLPAGARVAWVQARAASIDAHAVHLATAAADGHQDDQAAGSATLPPLSYDYLVVATGSSASQGLPSRIAADDGDAAAAAMRDVQARVASARTIVVVGGGAAGVEFATDAKSHRPDATVVLVHSRSALMHRFGPELQAAALAGVRALGVEVVLDERGTVDDDGKVVTLRSGRKIECDLFVSCIGQRPSSQILAGIAAPSTFSPTGHIRVRETLQVADDSLPHVYACGDVADAGVQNPNGRSAAKQAQIVAENILRSIAGRKPDVAYKPHWADAVIKLTMGLKTSLVQFGDDTAEILWQTKEKDDSLMVASAWKHMGATPFDDGTDQLAQYRLDLTKSN